MSRKKQEKNRGSSPLFRTKKGCFARNSLFCYKSVTPLGSYVFFAYKLQIFDPAGVVW